MFAVYLGPCNGSDTNLAQAIGIVDPETLSFEAVWEPPGKYPGTQLNFAYMQLLMETSEIVISAVKGQIYILKKTQGGSGSPGIAVKRTIDLNPSGVLHGQPLVNSVMDAAGNVWFTTGSLTGVEGAQPTNVTVIGYVEQDGTIHSLEIPNQTVENGISVSDTTVFVVTGPSAADDHANAVGFMAAFQPGPGSSVNVIWNGTYQAGSFKKPGAFARGCGTTPALLGNDFVAIADNEDVQTNLLIWRQDASGEDVTPVCTLPLFSPNASRTDNGAMVHYDGKDYSVVMQSMYNAPSLETTDDINGSWNNLTSMAPGITKFFVAGDGSGCRAEWTNTESGRQTTVPVLSTATGLIYGYEQSLGFAEDGEYVWYASAIDYESGETVWKARTGAGGAFNNQYRTMFLDPKGTMYQLVLGGVVILKDSE